MFFVHRYFYRFQEYIIWHVKAHTAVWPGKRNFFHAVTAPHRQLSELEGQERLQGYLWPLRIYDQCLQGFLLFVLECLNLVLKAGGLVHFSYPLLFEAFFVLLQQRSELLLVNLEASKVVVFLADKIAATDIFRDKLASLLQVFPHDIQIAMELGSDGTKFSEPTIDVAQ